MSPETLSLCDTAAPETPDDPSLETVMAKLHDLALADHKGQDVMDAFATQKLKEMLDAVYSQDYARANEIQQVLMDHLLVRIRDIRLKRG